MVFLPVALGACSPPNQGTELFDRRVKCDELVRGKFTEMETANVRFVYPFTSISVTSNYTTKGDCYGLLERNDKRGFIRILIDGVSGRDLAQYVKTEEYVLSGMMSAEGEWINHRADTDLRVTNFIRQKMSEK